MVVGYLTAVVSAGEYRGNMWGSKYTFLPSFQLLIRNHGNRANAFIEDSTRKVQFQNKLYSAWRPSTILKQLINKTQLHQFQKANNIFKGGAFVNFAF